MFDAFSLKDVKPVCILVPAQEYLAPAQEALAGQGINPAFMVPLDTMLSWGV
jgi:hypothetical protein